MPGTIRKPAAKKKAEPQQEGIPVYTLEADAAYQTKGTFRLDETGDESEFLVGSLYLKKSALDGISPTRVRVTVEVLEVGEVKTK